MDAIERYELLGRYLDAVSRQLPRRNRRDVARELRETLVSHVEDRESDAGRHLTEDEIAAILMGYGRPDIVARSYGANRSLIGPEVFPAYLFAVKLALCVIAIPTAISVVLAATSGGGHVAWNVARALWLWLQIALLNLAGTTLVFALGERRFRPLARIESWDPRDLPETSAAVLRADTPVPFRQALASLAGMTGMLLWWLGANALLWRWFGWSELSMEWSPIWADLTPVAVTILAAAMAREIVAILRPRATMFYRTAGLVLNVAGAILVIRLLRAGSFVEATVEAPPGALIAPMVHGMIFVSLTVILVVTVADTAINLHRLWILTGARRAVTA